MELNWSQTVVRYQLKTHNKKLTRAGNEIPLRKNILKSILSNQEKASINPIGNRTTKTQKDHLLLMLLWRPSLWEKLVYWHVL